MYMLYDRRSCKTGRALRRSLGLPGGLPTHYQKRPHQDFLVRWGSTAGPDGEITLNEAAAVAKAADKLRSLELMQEAGVQVVPFGVNPRILEFPILGRSRNHHAGSDIRVYKSESEMRGGHAFYTQFIPSTHEMRIHIVDGQMIRAQLKKGTDSEIPIRNHDNGYFFTPYVHTRPDQKRVDVAKRAVSALGLDFGAVDMLCTRGDQWVLEVNSSAGCCRATAVAYMHALSALAERDGVRLRPDERQLDILEATNEEVLQEQPSDHQQDHVTGHDVPRRNIRARRGETITYVERPYDSGRTQGRTW